MRTGSRAEATQNKQAVILEAALTCFDRHGVVGTTMEHIRSTAGVSVGSLYHHYPNKEAIAATLYVHLIRQYQSSASRSVTGLRSPKARVQAAIQHHIEWSIENPIPTRFLLANREPDIERLAAGEVQSLNRDLENQLQGWLDKEAERGSIRQMSADIYISLVIGPAHYFVRRWVSESTSTPPSAAITALTEAAWRAVRAEQRPAAPSSVHRPKKG